MNIDEALRRLRKPHYNCEGDPWYGCPRSVDGCANEADGDECNCGADEWNEEELPAILTDFARGVWTEQRQFLAIDEEWPERLGRASVQEMNRRFPATKTEPCGTCGGSGEVTHDVGDFDEPAPMEGPCPDCKPTKED